MAHLLENITPTSFENIRCNRIQYNTDGTGSHGTTELEWKDYCPEAFRNIQELDHVGEADYSMVLCANEILKEVTSPAKPGRVFFVSVDQRLVVKTLRKVELKGILDMFPSYYFHLSRHPLSLLVRLYGLHSVRQLGGIKVYFIVMGNTLPPDVTVSDRYHLKGISRGRKHQNLKVEDYILRKDFDFDYRFYLPPSIREKLLAQIKTDCIFLEGDDRMDYSIVLSVSMPCSPEGFSIVSKSSHRKSNASRKSSVDSDCSSQESEDTQLRFSDVSEYLESREFRYDRGMPARAVRRRVPEMGLGCRKTAESFNVLLYFTILDFYQKYNMKKRLEHLYKSIQHDTKCVSTVNPKDYCSRFLDFAEQVFLPEL